jgi:fucose permease
MTVVNFAVAMAIPRLTSRLGQAVPLTSGVGLTLAGMAWLAQVAVTSSYWTAVALLVRSRGGGFLPVQGLPVVGGVSWRRRRRRGTGRR